MKKMLLLFKLIRASKWWNTFEFMVSLGLFAAIVIFALKKSGWKFTEWLLDLLDIIWPIAFLFAIIFFGASNATRKNKVSSVDAQTKMQYKYNKLQEAYNFMKYSAISGLIGLLTLWLTFRYKK